MTMFSLFKIKQNGSQMVHRFIIDQKYEQEKKYDIMPSYQQSADSLNFDISSCLDHVRD